MSDAQQTPLPRRRRRPSFFALCSAASGILCALICLLWVRSLGVNNRLEWRGRYEQDHLWLARGSVVLHAERRDWRGYPPDYYGWKFFRTPAEPYRITYLLVMSMEGDWFSYSDRAGGGWYIWTKRNADYFAVVVLPFWLLMTLSALLPVAYAMMRWRARRRARWRERLGRCIACGYDLRGLAPRQTCPECGYSGLSEEAAAKMTGTKRKIPAWLVFAGGCGATTLVFLLVVLPMSKQAVRDQQQKEVNDPLWGAIYYTYQSANNGDAESARKQLQMMSERFGAYGGTPGAPAPSEWWREVANYKKSLPKPATTKASQ